MPENVMKVLRRYLLSLFNYRKNKGGRSYLPNTSAARVKIRHQWRIHDLIATRESSMVLRIIEQFLRPVYLTVVNFN